MRTDRLLSDLASALAPARCPGCGRRAEPVCAECSARLRPAPPLPPPTGIEWWAAPFAYEGAARELLARVKYRNHRYAVPWLAGEMAECIRTNAPFGIDVVTFPPTTRSRRRDRGFDHAELLAHDVARRLGLPHAALLARLDDRAQTGRTRAERRNGPVFAARRPSRESVVLVVDDIATTGATLAAAARALRAGGADRVIATTGARTPAKG